MPGGPIFPSSAFPVTSGRVFPTALTPEMPQALAFEASLGADAVWRLFYQLPPTTLPSGTAKLLLICQANATAGNAKLNPKWKSYGANEVPAAADLIAEGVATITFSTTVYRLTETKITLDADTLVAGELVMLDLVGETSGWTLLPVLGVLPPAIIWE
jgi:hypothetical protein